ncbi:hypothetical protein D0C36_14345 [Mucilaginibacter conchicola]|uniref:Uncharacterized protein n=1 Tax=Mucilaginibacter conchicola TaxID=2303333 RepID=A0A372NTI7_9SPHI|nr:outer membrane beta-barrel protein [Mucilaginibacter conchicola]RFZ92593.1 hypothetical protein D0C36_14345 [Mucilaginibacter conchicola]
MIHFNLSKKLLFIPLLCAAITASAQTNSLTGEQSPALQPSVQLPVAAQLKMKTADESASNYQAAPATRNVFKQAEDSGKLLTFGIEPEAILPMGSFGDLASAGVGINVKAFYSLGDIGVLTGSVGYHYFLAKENDFSDFDYKYSGIPIRFGFQYTLAEKFFVEPQLGFYNFRTSISSEDAEDEEFPGASGSGSSTNFFFALRAGYRTGERSNLSLGYNNISASGGSTSFLGLSYCFTF